MFVKRKVLTTAPPYGIVKKVIGYVKEAGV